MDRVYGLREEGGGVLWGESGGRYGGVVGAWIVDVVDIPLVEVCSQDVHVFVVTEMNNEMF